MQKVLVEYLGRNHEQNQGHGLVIRVGGKDLFLEMLSEVLQSRDCVFSFNIEDSENEFILTKSVAEQSVFLFIN